MVNTNPQHPSTPEEIVEFAKELWRNEPIRAAIVQAGPDSFLDEATVRAIDEVMQYVPDPGTGWRRDNMLLAEAVIRRINSGQFKGFDDPSVVDFLLDRMIPDLHVYPGFSSASNGPGRISPATFEEMMDFSRAVRNNSAIWAAILNDPGGDLARDENLTLFSNYEKNYRRANGMPNRRGFLRAIGVLGAFAAISPDVDVESQAFQDRIRQRTAYNRFDVY
ncbi:hypothetical protein [Tabrizicola sp.]|uniref:hypothetical protein n=1 Tax=Tabrizicola sp. TaxID=2005166 RepID=UPI003F2AD142